jgi:hypothetical protein
MKSLLHLIFIVLMSSSAIAFQTGEPEEDSAAFEFIFFKVKETSTSLMFHWQVEYEKADAKYVLEKSVSDGEWSEVTSMESVVNDSSYYDYYYSIENRAEEPVEKFRLKRSNGSGEEEVLKESLLIREVLSRMKITSPPGKSNKEANVSYYSLIDIKVHITVVNRDGDIFYEENTTAHKGENSFNLKLKKFKEDRYLVVVKDIYENKVSKGLRVY